MTDGNGSLILRPQPGPQERFLATSADICVFGGSAGGGKSYGLLLTPLRYMETPGFTCTIFRKNYNQIFAQGGLWDESNKLYSQIDGAEKRNIDGSWTFHLSNGDIGGRVKFAHLERNDAVQNWQGSQICELCCEETTPVLMADGTYKALRDIKTGDCVMTLNGASPITAIGRRKLKDCVEIVLSNGDSQIQTTDHQFLTEKGWISFDEIIQQDTNDKNSDSTLCCCEWQSSEFEKLEDEEFLKRVRECICCLRHICEQIQQFVDRQDILAPSSHILCESLHASISESNLCDCVQECNQCFRQKYQEFLRLLDNQRVDRRQGPLIEKSISDHQELPEIFSCMVQQDQENYCESFLDCSQALVRRILDLREQEHSLQSHELFQDILRRDEVFGGLLDGFSYQEQQDFLDCCLICSRLYDELSPTYEENVRAFSHKQACVVVRTPTCCTADGQDSIPTDSLRLVQYAHPYTGERLISNPVHVDCLPYKITPIGKRYVIDITVANYNHYITKCGFVNRNCFDELTHFSEYQFFYMLSRNRSMCGVKPFVRATCNPDANSWVANFISWWIDPETGYPIPERSGTKRWFIRRDEQLYWADRKSELWKQFNLVTPEEKEEPKSATFIASSIYDNKELLKVNPAYLANLKALSLVERERLLYGNWKIKPSAGLYFKRSQLGNVLEVIPNDVIQWVRCWDLAATPEKESGEAAYTAGVLMGKRKNGRYIVADVINKRLEAAEVRNLIRLTAQEDRAKFKRVRNRLPQDPGQAGKEQAQSYIKLLSGFDVVAVRESGSKESRAEPMAAQWQAGNFDIVHADWNEPYLEQLENFPEWKFKDMVDASANAFAELELKAQFNLGNLI